MRESPPPRSRLQSRRAVLVALAAAAGSAASQPLPGSFENWRRLFGGPEAAADANERARLLAEGEALLAAGEALAAQELFQRAAMLMHAPDTECSIVRAQMQAGNYRQALAFCAHAALAHRGFAGGVALYAWLLHVGGQSVIAARLLVDAMERQPEDAALQAVRDALRQPQPIAGAALLAPPGRLAPYAHGSATASDARALGGAVLAERHTAWAPRAALQDLAPGAALWVRNGLGLTVAATIDPALPAPDAALLRLRLHAPMSWPEGLALAPARLFAGAPASVAAFAPQPTPAWPLLRALFLGRTLADGTQALALQPSPSAPGGAVFDRNGQLAGMALAHADGIDRFLPCAQWPGGVGDGDAARPVTGADDIYERALHIGLQLLTPAA